MSCHHSYELCVSQVPIFAHLSNETQQLVFKKINHRYFSKNEMLYMEGDKLDSLYVVHKGRVRIYRLNDEGEEQLIRVLAMVTTLESFQFLTLLQIARRMRKYLKMQRFV